MKAALFYHYGDETELVIEDIPMPVVKDDDVLIKVITTSINGSDKEFLEGKPLYARIIGPLKPSKRVLGSDIAGIVETVGANVTEFQKGDAVFCDNFERLGGFAEYASVPQNKVVPKPQSLNFSMCSTIPQAGVIAMQGLSKYGDVQSGQNVLINGAGGSAGSFAVQMALRAGANVTAIDHHNKQDFLTALGAHHVYDYERLPKTFPAKYDKILDLVGHQSVTFFGRLLSVHGTYVMVGGRMADIFGVLIKGGLLSIFGPKKFSILAHIQNQSDMLAVAEMLEKNEIKATIDQEFPLDDIQQAFKRVLQQRSTGKVVIRLSNEQL